MDEANVPEKDRWVHRDGKTIMYTEEEHITLQELFPMLKKYNV